MTLYLAVSAGFLLGWLLRGLFESGAERRGRIEARL